MDACTLCGSRSRRCVNGSVALLCDDAMTVNARSCAGVDDENALAVTKNHVAKCAEGLFADGVL